MMAVRKLEEKEIQPKPGLMDKRGLSIYLSKPVRTIERWVFEREIPYKKLGRSIVFEKEEIDGWLKSKTVKPTKT